jgi:hypothetical protein
MPGYSEIPQRPSAHHKYVQRGAGRVWYLPWMSRNLAPGKSLDTQLLVVCDFAVCTRSCGLVGSLATSLGRGGCGGGDGRRTPLLRFDFETKRLAQHRAPLLIRALPDSPPRLTERGAICETFIFIRVNHTLYCRVWGAIVFEVAVAPRAAGARTVGGSVRFS